MNEAATAILRFEVTREDGNPGFVRVALEGQITSVEPLDVGGPPTLRGAVHGRLHSVELSTMDGGNNPDGFNAQWTLPVRIVKESRASEIWQFLRRAWRSVRDS